MAMMMFGWSLMAVLAAAVVALLVWGLSTAGRAFRARGSQDGGQRSALRTPGERLASGEVDREEFERRREVPSH